MPLDASTSILRSALFFASNCSDNSSMRFRSFSPLSGSWYAMSRACSKDLICCSILSFSAVSASKAVRDTCNFSSFNENSPPAASSSRSESSLLDVDDSLDVIESLKLLDVSADRDTRIFSSFKVKSPPAASSSWSESSLWDFDELKNCERLLDTSCSGERMVDDSCGACKWECSLTFCFSSTSSSESSTMIESDSSSLLLSYLMPTVGRGLKPLMLRRVAFE